MDRTAQSQHLELNIDRRRDEDVVLHLLPRVLLVLLDEAHANVGKQVVLEPILLQLEHFADSIVLVVALLALTVFFLLFLFVWLGSFGGIFFAEVKPDAERKRVVLVLLQAEAVG